MEQVQVTLPTSLMKTMRAIGSADEMTAIEKLEAMVLIAHGYGLWDRQAALDPTMTSIPESQWSDIAKLLMNCQGDDLARVNLSLDWMNLGPSAFQGDDDVRGCSCGMADYGEEGHDHNN